MIVRNNKEIINIYRGTRSISNVYRGGVLVYTGEQPEPITYDGLTFEALEPSTIQYVPSTVASAQYSYDTVNWNNAANVTLNLNVGDRVFFKGNITSAQTSSDYAKFTMSGKISASGSIMSLQAGNPQDKSLKYNYEFIRLFQNCKVLVSAPELSATTIRSYCYAYMFDGCSRLEKAPSILPAATCVTYCYQYMFRNCSKLTQAPVLSATTMASDCYYYMFSGCSSLQKAPDLPATSLKSRCYGYMFYNCSKLNYIKAMFTSTPSTTFTQNWVSGVAATGTFVKNKSATWNVTGVNGIPTGWTVELA